MQFFDTHCHFQESQADDNPEDMTQKLWSKAGKPSAQDIINRANQSDVTGFMCVGCAYEDSVRAIKTAADHEGVWASIGIHPHEAKVHLGNPELLEKFAALATKPKVKVVGECGLDYYYENSPRQDQQKILHFQIELALKHDLPMIFHVRDAFDDFWPIFDEYKGVRGVIHSFTATPKELEDILARGLYIGLNGIMTFTKQQEQLAAAKAVPLDRFVLETDAPFLTPAPYRGTICEPKHVRTTAEFLADLRGESLATIADATTQNARKLFDL